MKSRILKIQFVSITILFGLMQISVVMGSVSPKRNPSKNNHSVSNYPVPLLNNSNKKESFFFTPDIPPSIPGLQLWLDASDVTNTGTNPANNSSINTWKDRSGNNHDASVLSTSSAGIDPILVTNLTGGQLRNSQINGMPVVHFTRINDFNGTVFEVPGLDLRASSLPQTTIFTVYRPTSFATGVAPFDQAVWGVDNGGWDRFFFTSFPSLAGNLKSDGGVAYGINAIKIDSSGLLGKTQLLTAAYDHLNNSINSNNSSVYLNGKKVKDFDDLTDPTAAQIDMRIGWDGDNNTFDGDIAEVLVYNRKLTPCEIQTINRYLANKYGISFSTASIDAAGPTNIDFGNSVRLSSHTTGTAYQWMKDGVNIPSANGSSYNANAAGDYQVIVTNTCNDTSAITKVTINPTILLTGTLANFTACKNLTSAEQSFSVQGVNLNTSITVTAPTGFEISTTSGTGYASSITLSSNAGAVPSTNVFIRLAATATGNPSGNIQCSSTGATTKNLSVTSTINALPVVAAITGTQQVCIGNSSSFANTTAGGVWSSSNTNIATINTQGLINGIATGISTISYTVTNGTGCISTVTRDITVNPLPTVAAITGPSSVCQTKTITLANATVGGTWASNNTGIATISNVGVVTGLAAGTATINYTVTNSNGCVNNSSYPVVVNSVPPRTALTNNVLICKATNLTVNAGISSPATYAWTSASGQFNSSASSISITNPDLYRLTITLANGCTYLDSVLLTNTTLPAIPAKMIVTSQAFVNANVAAVNLTTPTPQTQTWIIPNGAQIVSQSPEQLILKFPVTGTYQIGLQNTSYNVCSSSDVGKVVISNTDSASVTNNNLVLVREVTVGPNPSTGVFNFTIKLNRSGKASLKIYSLLGNPVYSVIIPDSGNPILNQKVDISSSPRDTYVAVVQTANGNEVRTLIKN